MANLLLSKGCLEEQGLFSQSLTLVQELFWETVDVFSPASWGGASHRPDGRGRELNQAGALALACDWCLRVGGVLGVHIPGSASVPGQPGVEVRPAAWGQAAWDCRLLDTHLPGDPGQLSDLLNMPSLHLQVGSHSTPRGILSIKWLIYKVFSRVSKMQITQ